jgi:LysM repeat protein
MHNAQHRPPTSLLHIMDRRLSRYGEDYYLVDWFAELPERFELIPCYDEYFTARYLDSFVQDHFNHATMRAIAYERQPPLEPLNNDQLVCVVARRLVSGSLRLALAPPLSFGGLGDDETPDQPRAPTAVQTKAMFSLQAVDDVTDDPISNVKLVVKLPDAKEHELATDSSGRIDLSVVKSGTVSVSSSVTGATMAKTMAFVKLGALASTTSVAATGATRGGHSTTGQVIAQLIECRVKTGDTLDSLARRHGLTANALAQFHWGTAVRDEIDQYLIFEVGCRKRGSDQHVLFDSADDPGIIYIPAPVRLNGLALDQLHILRVKKPFGRRAFSVSD